MATKNTIASSADGVLGSPLRNLSVALIFVAVVYATATAGYLAAGWTLNDAAYMVTLTIFSVGYDEVHPIDTGYLRALTTGTIVLGCTEMIVLTRAGAGLYCLSDTQNVGAGSHANTDRPFGESRNHLRLRPHRRSVSP